MHTGQRERNVRMSSASTNLEKMMDHISGGRLSCPIRFGVFRLRATVYGSRAGRAEGMRHAADERRGKEREGMNKERSPRGAGGDRV